jgi:hypothetical protein
VLGAALGATALTAAAALERPVTVLAGTDGDVVLGDANETLATTSISVAGEATVVSLSGEGHGLESLSQDGVAVIGISGVGKPYPTSIDPSTGVYGLSLDGMGVYGGSNAGPGVYGATNGSGVAAVTGQGNQGTGVHGWTGDYEQRDTTPNGVGVYGSATQTGTGVSARTHQGTALLATSGDPMSGYAIRASGRVRFDKCAGVASIGSGKRSVVITPGVRLGPTSAVVATLQGNAGGSTTVQRVAIDTTNHRFTIYLTANSTTTVKVAWHLIG